MLSTPLEISLFFLLFADTLAKVIDENPVKAFNFPALYVFVCHLLQEVPPWGRPRSFKEINADQSLMLLVFRRNILPQQDFLNHIFSLY